MSNHIIEYFRTSKEELEKVSWPSREVTLRYGVVIIVGSVVAALFFGTLDFGAGRLVKATLGARTPATANTATPETPTTQAPPVEIEPDAVQATDVNGNKVDLDVKTLPVDTVPSAPTAPAKK